MKSEHNEFSNKYLQETLKLIQTEKEIINLIKWDQNPTSYDTLVSEMLMEASLESDGVLENSVWIRNPG